MWSNGRHHLQCCGSPRRTMIMRDAGPHVCTLDTTPFTSMMVVVVAPAAHHVTSSII